MHKADHTSCCNRVTF